MEELNLEDQTQICHYRHHTTFRSISDLLVSTISCGAFQWKWYAVDLQLDFGPKSRRLPLKTETLTTAHHLSKSRNPNYFGLQTSRRSMKAFTVTPADASVILHFQDQIRWCSILKCHEKFVRGPFGH
ncbi:hypothetical protein L2E82_27410 [Cichorium intybus]|uniref:Uncharacterized protein n=1 Tax=Cichorium intybus TaxID=13427 RepID=A0ACB9CSX8_CICIN|nr:hypothetical protein L2E82_27410 [Cichorium intybus]